jgi:hypothetical protein
MNRSIKDALVAEENFFRSRPVRKLLCIVVFKTFDLYIIYTDVFIHFLFIGIPRSSR